MDIEEYRIEILTIIFSSMTTILALITSFIFPEIQILVLTILTIMLPLIYQIGHICSKEAIREKNDRNYSIVEESNKDKDSYIEELEEENSNLIDFIDDKKQYNKK